MQTINTQLTGSGRPPWFKWIAIAAPLVVFAFAGSWFLTRRSTTTKTVPPDSMAAMSGMASPINAAPSDGSNPSAELQIDLAADDRES